MNKILGIDLGTGSIGVSLRNPNLGSSLFEQLEYFSSDIFQSGVGKDKSGEYSLAAERSSHRQSRRLKASRRRRLWATLELLIEYGLCPLDSLLLKDWKTYDKSKALFRSYPNSDKAFSSWIMMDFDCDGIPDYSSPYQLRRELATVQLDFAKAENKRKLGRALYHIAQRRGFKSSKRETMSAQENDNKESFDLSDKDIALEMQKSESKLSQDLKQYMAEHQCHTVGEAFACLEDEGIRVRNSRYAAVRTQYEDEIRFIFDFQNGLSLDSDLFKRLISKKKGVGTIFYRKPLRSQKWLVGKCTLETNKTRCPISHPEYEKFRAFCLLNNIKIRTDYLSDWHPLTVETKRLLFDQIFTKRVKADFPFKDIREKLQILLHQRFDGDCTKERRTINYKDKVSIAGCPVIARVRNLLGDEWEQFHAMGQKQRTSHSKHHIGKHCVEYSAYDIWHICYETDDPEYLTEFALQKLNWDEDQAKKLVRLWSTQAQGYAMLSLKAITNINRFLEMGLIYSDAVLLAKIPDIIPMTNDDIKNLVNVYTDTIKDSITQEKTCNTIVNSLIANYKATDVTHQFAFHNTSYTLDEADRREVERQIVETIGIKTWGLMDVDEQRQIYDTVERKYQEFFSSTQRDYFKLPKLSDALIEYLTGKYPNIPLRQWKKLYHPSQISLYNVDKVTDSGSEVLRLGSPSIGAMRNPVARKTLNILRRKINAMLDAGLIDVDDTRIVVETTRQFNDSNMRWAIETYQRERENENQEIRKLLEELLPGRKMSESDITAARIAFEQQGVDKYKEKGRVFGIDVSKYRLWKEQGGICMYTGKLISISNLFKDGCFDVEHTIPRSLSFDSSDMNLTMCDTYYNRSIKQNRIPTELPNFEHDAVINGVLYTAIKPRLEAWENRVERLRDNVNFWKAQSRKAIEKSRKDYCIRQRHLWEMELNYWQGKVSRFTMTEVTDGFRNSQLVDTGIITKYATLYLKSLFHNVEVQKGSATAEFRKMLGIQAMDEKKNRSLHSHHAIDATVLTLIPVAAKRQKMLKLYYEIEELKELGLNSDDKKAMLRHEIEECEFEKDVSLIPSYIEEHIVAKHHSEDRTFDHSKRRPDKNNHVAGGDSVRGRLHKDTYYGAIKLPQEIGTGIDRMPMVKDGKFVYPANDAITMVMNVEITSFTSEKDFSIIIDPRVRMSIAKAVEKRLGEGLSFKEAINQPFWMLNDDGIEIKEDKNGKPISPIRHVRCKVKAGRGFMTAEKALEIRQHNFVSTKSNVNVPNKDYKRKVYAQNDTNYLYLLYEGIKKGKVDRKSRIVNLWEATLLKKNYSHQTIDTIIRETSDYNHITEKNVEYRLSAIIRVGDYVLLWKDSPDELRGMDVAHLSTRLYIVVKFNTTGADLLYLKAHLSAKIETDVQLVANNVNCLIEHRDFEIDTLGFITFKD